MASKKQVEARKQQAREEQVNSYVLEKIESQEVGDILEELNAKLWQLKDSQDAYKKKQMAAKEERLRDKERLTRELFEAYIRQGGEVDEEIRQGATACGLGGLLPASSASPVSSLPSFSDSSLVKAETMRPLTLPIPPKPASWEASQQVAPAPAEAEGTRALAELQAIPVEQWLETDTTAGATAHDDPANLPSKPNLIPPSSTTATLDDDDDLMRAADLLMEGQR